MPSPAIEKRWRSLSRAVAISLANLEEGDFLIISHRRLNYYVQVAGQGEHGLRVEAVSNTYIEPPSAALTTEQYARMRTLGWHRATEHPPELKKRRRKVDGSPNFYRQAAVSEDVQGVADVMIRTLQEVYDIATPTLLQYQAFNRTLGAFKCPELPIARVVRD